MTTPLSLDVVAAAQPQIDAAAAAIPVIETDRLVLRAPCIEDWPVLEPIWTTGRGRYIGGPMSAGDAWLDFNQLTAGWLPRGYGALTITLRSDQAVLGLVLLEHEFGDPEPELGWLLCEAAEGQGFALEAARALLPMAREVLGPGNFVSYIHRDNIRSIRLAEKLGAVRDAGGHPSFAEALVYRHGGVP